ncbi:MAG: alanine racemase [Elusimicrobia bacterium]|nr:alanine racemase [Elusimicrobiota bacterium]
MLKWIEIDLKVIRANTRAIKRSLKPGVGLMAVVKAGGYGHGGFETAKAALSGGAGMLGVLTLEESIALRAKGVNPVRNKPPQGGCRRALRAGRISNGVKADIAALAPAPAAYAKDFIRNRVIPTVDSLDFIKALDAHAPACGKTPYYIDIDSGLKRWGVAPKDFPAFIKAALKFKRTRPIALSTHIAYAPQKNMIEAEEKLSSFKALGDIARIFYPDIKLHAANSAILCDFPHWQLDMVRIGNLLYGLYPSNVYLKKTKGPPLKGLERPWKFYARVISIKSVRKGESLGYASEYVACRPMKIATIPAGFSDGLTLEPAEKAIKISAGQAYWGIINGKTAPFVGKAAIAHTLLDITAVPGVRIGTPVLLPIRRTAASARIPRIYK